MSNLPVSLQEIQRSTRPVLFYDGDCGFCSSTVQFILDHESCDNFRFASLQSPLANALRKQFPSQLAGVDSLIVLTPSHLLIKSDAACFVAKYLRFPCSLGVCLKLIPRFLRDAVYDAIAKQRLKISESFGLSCRRFEAAEDRFIS